MWCDVNYDSSIEEKRAMMQHLTASGVSSMALGHAQKGGVLQVCCRCRFLGKKYWNEFWAVQHTWKYEECVWKVCEICEIWVEKVIILKLETCCWNDISA